MQSLEINEILGPCFGCIYINYIILDCLYSLLVLSASVQRTHDFNFLFKNSLLYMAYMPLSSFTLISWPPYSADPLAHHLFNEDSLDLHSGCRPPGIIGLQLVYGLNRSPPECVLPRQRFYRDSMGRKLAYGGEGDREIFKKRKDRDRKDREREIYRGTQSPSLSREFRKRER